MRRDKFFNELASIQQHNITPTIAAFCAPLNIWWAPPMSLLMWSAKYGDAISGGGGGPVSLKPLSPQCHLDKNILEAIKDYVCACVCGAVKEQLRRQCPQCSGRLIFISEADHEVSPFDYCVLGKDTCGGGDMLCNKHTHAHAQTECEAVNGS